MAFALDRTKVSNALLGGGGNTMLAGGSVEDELARIDAEQAKRNAAAAAPAAVVPPPETATAPTPAPAGPGATLPGGTTRTVKALGPVDKPKTKTKAPEAADEGVFGTGSSEEREVNKALELNPWLDPAQTALEVSGINTPERQKLQGYTDVALQAAADMTKYAPDIHGVGGAVSGTAGELLPMEWEGLFQSEPYRLYNQAALSFLNSIMRPQTGAVINYVQEAPMYYRMMLDLPFDTPAIRESKQRLRDTEIAISLRSGGAGYRPVHLTEAEKWAKTGANGMTNPQSIANYIHGWGIKPESYGYPAATDDAPPELLGSSETAKPAGGGVDRATFDRLSPRGQELYLKKYGSAP